MPKEPERGGGRNELRKKVTAADNGGNAGDADYMGDVRLEPLFEFAPVGALTYEGWQIRPVGSGFLLISPDERIKGVCDNLEAAFLMLLGKFGFEEPPDDYKPGAGILLRPPQADTA